jgi:3-hydroxyacyl-CoA dehydrogenase
MLNEKSRAGRAVVLGAGVMGAGIAAHLANIGWTVHLLDRVPDVGGSSSNERNRLAQVGLDRALRSRPPQLALPEYASRICVGNLEDDLDRLAAADWIVEAVAEDMAVKKAVFRVVAAHASPQTVISSNTSGLSLAGMIADCPADVRARFFGTHFFNPPRYMKPVELIPTRDTDRSVFEEFARFADRVLGKRVIRARDTPGFISTRLGMYALVKTMELAVRHGMTVEETDYLTGPLLGRPKSGTFRLADVVGLDVTARIIANLKSALPEDAAYRALRPPSSMMALIDAGRTGAKSGEGYTRKAASGMESLDLASGDYRAREDPELVASGIESLPLAERIPALLADAPTRYRDFLGDMLIDTLGYMADKTPEVSGRIVEVDDALMGGFGWKDGPFMLLGYLGDVAFQGDPPALVRQLHARGLRQFYTNEQGRHYFFDFQADSMRELQRPPGVMVLKDVQKANGVLEQTDEASLVDIGDGALCLAWRTKMGTLNPGITEMLERALARAEADFKALVIVGGMDPFSAGFDLALLGGLIEAGKWDEIDGMMHRLQRALLALKYGPLPVVGAASGYALGGGCEILMHCAAVQVAFESSIGLPEANAGLIPTGGGVAQTVIRAVEQTPPAAPLERSDVFTALRVRWNNLRQARFAASAPEAVRLGYMRTADGITMQPDRLLHDARERALAMAADYRPGVPQPVPVTAEDGLTRFRWEIHLLKRAGQITEHDARIALALARVMCGGALIHETNVTESYLLDLEREAFLSIAGTPETVARLKHLMATGKPLKN